MSHINFRLPLFTALALALFSTAKIVADDEQTKDAPAAGQADEFTLPEGGADELLEFIRSMMRRQPRGETRAELFADFKKAQNAAVAAADKLYKISDDDGASGLQQAVLAARVKNRILEQLQEVGDKQAAAKQKEFAEMIAKDKRAEVAAVGRQILTQLKYRFPRDADEQTVKKLGDELKKEFAEGEIAPEFVSMIMDMLQRLEMSDRLAVAADLNDYFAKRFSQSSNPRIASFAERLAGTARRLKLPGNPIEISGKLLEGKDFDWASYKGKVVLVDYWATWCGPCIQELPNVLANYEKYHERGFEVVGISLDVELEKVEAFVEDRKIPWSTLFSDDPAASGWEHPMARRYGISGIPAVILVNQEGKVVSLNARGEELGRLLADLLDADSSEAGKGEKSGDASS